MRLGRRTLATLRQHAWWAPVESFAVSLRPVWWVARAWSGLRPARRARRRLPDGSRAAWAWLLLATAVVAKRAVGPRRLDDVRRARWLPVVANAVAVVAVLPVLSTLQDDVRTARWYPTSDAGTVVEYRETAVDGVVVDGMQVSNLFVYDAEGSR